MAACLMSSTVMRDDNGDSILCAPSCRRNFTAEDLRTSIVDSAKHSDGLKADMLSLKNDVKLMKDACENLNDDAKTLVPQPQQDSAETTATAVHDLDEFLARHNLERYAGELRDKLGAATPGDLKNLEEKDMDGLGLKMLEKKRLHQAIQGL